MADPAFERTLALLVAALDATDDGIFAVDLTGRVIACNRRFLDMFGLTRAQVEHDGVDGLVDALRTQIDNFDALIASSATVRSAADGAILDRIQFKDGRVYQRFLAPVQVDGATAGVVTTVRDITEARRTEVALEEHRGFLEKAQEVAHVGSWIYEADGSDRIEWSREAHRIFGVGAAEFEPRAASFYERVHPADREGVKAAVDAAVAGKAPYDLDHRILRPDGSVRWVHEKADVLRDPRGRALRMIGTVQDITERRQLEDQLRQAQKMEAIGRLAGGIAHDLNNALTAIAGYAELALGALDVSHQARADVEEIRRGAERAGSVTRQLLAFSRKELLEPRLFDLNQTISALGRLLARLLGADIQVRTELAPSVPPILGDPGQVEQAVINLAVNARDAMPNGGRLVLATSIEDLDEIAARANAPMAAGRYVVLRVTDTGHGMTPDTLSRIFEPFFTTKETGKGTGLGLSMVYGTLKQIGGFIFADSDVGRGTTFRLYFRPAQAAPGAPAGGDRAGTKSEATILVVEDEAAVRNLVASTLRTDGYTLLLAASAEEALETAARQGHIDLLLTDASMPGKSGIELANILTEKRPGLRVIIMSGYTEETLSGLGEHVDLLQKPFAPRELRRRVREALDQVRQSSR